MKYFRVNKAANEHVVGKQWQKTKQDRIIRGKYLLIKDERDTRPGRTKPRD